jgi:hypothetical protein
MKIKPESNSRNLGRSIGMGILLSMLFFYAIHVLGSWQIENYQPDPETSSTVLLHNKCAIFGNTHTLRPNTDVSAMSEGIDGTKLAAGFMNFFDGHITAMIIFSAMMTTLIFFIRKKIQHNRQIKETL